MKITSYVELTPAQEKTLEALETVTVRTSLIQPTVVATIHTFQVQEVKLTIGADGVIQHAEVQDV
ncbi:unnamed protein product [marine sediment metagenome]|uniref:Uncharacterized protein n=1 Tax=marine sediment metagenome TaxID=412755 RepID=X1QQS3_9ZZZZ